MMRDYKVLPLVNQVPTTDLVGTEVDLAPFIHVGGREFKVFAAVALATTDASTAFAAVVQLQQSPTTVTGDFTDIPGATLTLNGEAFPSLTEAHFQAGQQYVRAALSGANFGGTSLFVGLLAIERASD